MNENIAILVPCYNEEQTIEKVIVDFKKELPDATIYVYDNNSTDNTASVSKKAGAVVKTEFRQGKGNVVRSMFSDIEADYYIMVDGDDTYPADAVHQLLDSLRNGKSDMVIGDRLSNGTYASENKRSFHGFGNNLVRGSINFLYKSNINDIMTGYRGFNKYFVKNFPVLSPGFEIETELTIHSVDNSFLIEEIQIDYRDRPEGSESKLNTLSDGYKVLKTIMVMLKNSKPLFFFSLISLILAILSLIIGVPIIVDYAATGKVDRFPSAILSMGIMLVALGGFECGLILDTIRTNHKKTYFLSLLHWKGQHE
ncbi:MAG: glycosyltransferase family 2 protein [Vagococcus sp.]